MNRRNWGSTGLENIVVLVEDDTSLRENVEFLLRAERIRVVATADGMSGFAAIRRYRPKVVILDMYLPHVSGFEVIDEIRCEPSLEDIFVVAVTGMAEDEEDLREMKGRADVIIGKPIDENYLIEVIRAALERSAGATGLRRNLQDS